MNGQKIGYKRVSSIDQHSARQLDGVPLDKLFEDKASGKDTNRPELQAALSYCREGDIEAFPSRLRGGNLLQVPMRQRLTARGENNSSQKTTDWIQIAPNEFSHLQQTAKADLGFSDFHHGLLRSLQQAVRMSAD